jgi:hypothetical protein
VLPLGWANAMSAEGEAAAVFDHARHRKLADAIEKMVCSGEPALDEATVALVKAECRGNDAMTRTAFETTMIVMTREHAQIRLGCLRLYEYACPSPRVSSGTLVNIALVALVRVKQTVESTGGVARSVVVLLLCGC